MVYCCHQRPGDGKSGSGNREWKSLILVHDLPFTKLLTLHKSYSFSNPQHLYCCVIGRIIFSFQNGISCGSIYNYYRSNQK